MKKTIVTLAIICAAAVAQSATVTWASTKIYTASDASGVFSTTSIKAAATAYLFTLTESQYNSFLGDYNTSGNMSSVWNTYGESLSSANATGTTKTLTGAVSLTTEANVGDAVYGAIIYTYTDATYGDFYIANIATGTVGSDAGITITSLGSAYLGGTSTDAITGWQSAAAVPEPTSGLLLLIGMAGLALRRKRA